MSDKKEGINPKDLLGMTKAPLHLIPPVANAIASVAHFDGAIKYGPFNWREYPVLASIYVDAAKRHIDAWEEGEENASDSGAHHLGHAIACLNILLDAQSVGNLADDRPIPNKGYGKIMVTVSNQIKAISERKKNADDKK